ncbi:glycosyl hydrolase family protein [Nonomuraea longispora]|uniref:Glycosyl hydrolase family protein n=1 Tax=Nonomuraea longispora TaxID=1848320 RepID=A0A4R4NCS3_9ACTN|nr:family 1 glycosylhydrolase [Nonomuraea longispora]TDC04432.1 glycosyl hydrolase family protein [Nonomuraea longispora]
MSSGAPKPGVAGLGESGSIRFPDGFLWSASTAGFLMDGAPLADGAGPSIQHTFARTPGNRASGQSLEHGVDHYRRFQEDVALAREIGLQAFRFSISWSRVFPEGVGTVNRAALDHYDALVDALLEAGITPFPYLYYWDLPAALQDRGGWANRDCAQWFADYAAVMYDRLSDRVARWLTICEPWSIVHLGHVVGEDSPGIRDLRTALRVGHHLLLGHGLTVQAFRAGRAHGEIGLSTVMTDIRPASDRRSDRDAARRADCYFNRLFLDPILLGAYPDDLPDRLRREWPSVAEGDLTVISTPIDFLGVVYYLRLSVTGSRHGQTPADALPDGFEQLGIAELAAIERQETVLAELLDVHVTDPTGPVTELGWEIAPDGLSSVLCAIRDRYGDLPLYVAENGAAFPDTVTADGTVEDTARRMYIRDHLRSAHHAICDGVDLRGWSVWSLLDDPDNRFGLIHVDRETGRRTIKSSGYWYRDVIAANGLAAEDGKRGSDHPVRRRA